MNNDIPQTFLPHRHDVSLDRDYAQWMHELKSRYRQSQVKAAVKVNAEKLLFNWQLGRDLALRKAEERWGSGIVEQVSLDLQAEFPSGGFSAHNLWMMKRWYMFYTEKLAQLGQESAEQKLAQLVQEIHEDGNQNVTKLNQLGSELAEAPAEGMPFPVRLRDFFAPVRMLLGVWGER